MLKRAVVLGLSLLVTTARAQLPDADRFVAPYDGARGKYFVAGDSPTPRGIPTFEEGRSKLPIPVLPAEPELVEMYWKCWELAFRHMELPGKGSGLMSPYLDAAFSDNIFQWDTIFMMPFARYGHACFNAIGSLDNFYARQRADGQIFREIRKSDGADFAFLCVADSVNPPLFSWAEVEYSRVGGDAKRAGHVAESIDRYLGWLEVNRKANGVSTDLFWNTPLGSGMDNTPESGRALVSMSAQMSLAYSELAMLMARAGRPDRARECVARATAIDKAINDWMWNEADGLYYNLDGTGKQLPVRTIGCFWPLFSGTAAPERAMKLRDALMDERMFFRRTPFATLSAAETQFDPKGGYWLGASWAPTTYMAVKGLERYGFEEDASRAAFKYLKSMEEAFRATGTVWENYAPDSAAPGQPSKKDFVGWTGVGPIALLIENIIGIRCDAPGGTVRWRLARTDRHGVENLNVGGIRISLVYSPGGTGGEIRAESTAEISLEVMRDGQPAITRRLTAGQTTIRVP